MLSNLMSKTKELNYVFGSYFIRTRKRVFGVDTYEVVNSDTDIVEWDGYSLPTAIFFANTLDASMRKVLAGSMSEETMSNVINLFRDIE